jgi:hypothetical protein
VATPATSGCKWCPRCKQNLPVIQFPADRSRRDGRWHSCRDCNRAYWKSRGSELAAVRKERKRSVLPSRQGLAGLRRCQHRRQKFSSLPARLRPTAERLLSEYLVRHAGHLTGPRYAALTACAASNAQRVGDRSWARRMLRLKGYWRAERRKATDQPRGEQEQARYADTPGWSRRLDGI